MGYLEEHLDIESTVRHGSVSASVDAVGPTLKALVDRHGLGTVVDELIPQAGGTRAVLAALVQLVGWEDIAALVLAAGASRRQHDTTPERS